MRWRRRPRGADDRGLDDAQRALAAEHRRRAAALLDAGSAAASRALAAPAAYAFAFAPADLARHCQLLDQLPAADDVGLTITPADDGWQLDVVARDRPGLLASITGVLQAHAVGVVQAVIATWPDGVVLDAFVIDRAPDDHGALHTDLAVALASPLPSAPVPDAEVGFDNVSSPLFTRMLVLAPDRVGLLHCITTAIAVAGGDVHGAGVTTQDGVAVDRFDLTDQSGHKLSQARQHAIRQRVISGVEPGRRLATRRGSAARAAYRR